MLITTTALIFTVLAVEGSSIWKNDSMQEAEKKICMGELGCFEITSDFKSLRYRPVSVLPHDRVTINTRFLLFTRKNPKESHQLFASDKESITKSKFGPKDPVIFIVHGFMDNELFGKWMTSMKDELLVREDTNVIIVYWSGNKPPYYQATANTRVVGAEIALMIQTLEKHTGVKRDNCHVIGHSLGAHVAGYAGERLKTLGRITGCDPADPYFQNMPPSVRLDPTDATFVDVIHSDAVDIAFVGLGMTQKVGHVDFYPNSGRKQPGCATDRFTSFLTKGLGEGGRRFVSCNHQRSVDFMHASINYRKVPPVAYECADWKDFLDGKCTECGSDTRKCAIMGIRAIEYKPLKKNSVQHAMYVQTSGKDPYWMYHYQVSIKLHKPKTSYKDVKGTIEVTFFGSKADELFKVQSKSTDLKHGSTYQYLVTTAKELGDIKSLSLKWYSSSKNPMDLIKKPNLYVASIAVLPMNEIEKSPRSKTNRVFCDKPETGIAPRSVANFYKAASCIKLL